MDARVVEVLELYNARLATEAAARPASPDAARAAMTADWADNALLAIGADSGRFINILAGSLKAPRMLELGTSFGYSGIWLAEAASRCGGHVTSMEQAQHKSDHAKAMAEQAGLSAFIDFKVGDALAMIGEFEGGIDFVLLDLWKDLYEPSLDLFYPKLNAGAIIVADNMVYPGGAVMERYAAAVRGLPGMASVLVPVGSGLEISRFEG